MTRVSRKLLLDLGVGGDLGICALSLILSVSLLYGSFYGTDTLLLRNPIRQLIAVAVLAFCWHIALVAAGAYQSYRVASVREQALALAHGVTLAAVGVFLWLLLVPEGFSDKPYLLLEIPILFWVVSLGGLMAMRLGVRLVTRFLRQRGRNLRNVLLVGSNRRTVALADGLVNNSAFGYRLVGFVDDLWHYDEAPQYYKDMLLGNSGNILEFIRCLALDEVVIALPIASSYKLTQEIINACRQQGILVRCDASLFDTTGLSGKEQTTTLDLITLHDSAHHSLLAAAKRIFDLLVSTCALVLMLPLLAVISIAIAMTSEGPVLFKQERLGRGKRPFKIYKFRTMVQNAEALMAKVEHLNQTGGPTFKLEQDPRITRVGSFLRKTSLDELPQFFNVWLGDMSLVGPRPLPLRDYRGFSEDWHRRRFSVKPGITCLWQIHGRSAIGFDRWMELDMHYIDHWSLWLDCKILLRTIPAIMRGSGAM